jgi:GxxExxY protein
MDTDRKGLHEDLTENIIGAAFDVHNALGCGLLEKVYKNVLAWELAPRKRAVATQKEFKVFNRDKEVGVYYADLVVDNKVVVEVKSVDDMGDIHRAQILNYLRISGIRVGLLLNFARPKLKFERFIV